MYTINLIGYYGGLLNIHLTHYKSRGDRAFFVIGLVLTGLLSTGLLRQVHARGEKKSSTLSVLGKAYIDMYEKTQALGINPPQSERERVRKESMAPYFKARTEANNEVVKKYSLLADKLQKNMTDRAENFQKMKRNELSGGAKSKEPTERAYIEDVIGGKMISVPTKSRAPHSTTTTTTRVNEAGASVGEATGADSVDFGTPSQNGAGPEEPNFN